MPEQSTTITSAAQSPLHRYADEAVAAYRSPFKSERALKLAQARIRFDASKRRHVLGDFLQVIDKPAHLQSTCVHCGAGASVHVATAEVSVSELLVQPCLLVGGVRL